MLKRSILGVLYVSIWVIVWGTIGSLIDFPLLQSKIYEAGSIYQYLTFFLTAILTIFVATLLYSKKIKNYIE